MQPKHGIPADSIMFDLLKYCARSHEKIIDVLWFRLVKNIDSLLKRYELLLSLMSSVEDKDREVDIIFCAFYIDKYDVKEDDFKEDLEESARIALTYDYIPAAEYSLLKFNPAWFEDIT